MLPLTAALSLKGEGVFCDWLKCVGIPRPTGSGLR